MTYNDIYLSTSQLNRVLTDLLYESFCSGKNNITFVMLGVQMKFSLSDCVVYQSSVCTWHESSSIYCRRWDDDAKVIKVSAESRLAERIG